MSPDDTWMIFSITTGIPVMIAGMPLIGLTRPLARAVLRVLDNSQVDD